MSTATAPAFEAGQKVRFKGYSQKLEKGQKAIFTDGEIVEVTNVEDPDNILCKSILTGDPGYAFDSELEEVSDEEIEEAEQNAAKPAKAEKTPKLKKGKAPAAAEAPEKSAKTKKVKAEKVPKAPKQEEELEILPPESYSDSVQKATKTDAKAIETARTLTDKIEQTFWVLGGVLSVIRRRKSFQSLLDEDEKPLYTGKRGFANFVEQELDLHYRRALYYAEIHEAFAPLGIDEERILALGWSKLKTLSRVVNAKNVSKWLEKAESSNRDSLEAEVTTSLQKVSKGETSEHTPTTVKRTSFKFVQHEAQAATTLEALEAAKTIIGKDDNNEAFAHIVNEWFSLQGASKMPVETAIAALENAYGVAALVPALKKAYKLKTDK